MAVTPEGRVKLKVKALLKKHGIYYFMPATGGYGRSGVPDFICCAMGAPPTYHGHFLAIECKAAGGKVTALQAREMQRIQDNGGAALVVDEHSLDYLDEFLLGLAGLSANNLTSSPNKGAKA